MKTIKLTLPLPENFSNSRAHWRTKLRKKKAYWAACQKLLDAKLIKKPPRKAWEQTIITAHFRLWNTSDQSNLMARMKWPEDVLVRFGYIVDDAPKHLTYSGVPTQEIARKNLGLDITLQRVV